MTEIDWKQYSDGITMILFQGDINYARGHGVVKLGDKVLELLRQNVLGGVSSTDLFLCVVGLSFSSENCYIICHQALQSCIGQIESREEPKGPGPTC